ncbi:MAG: guanylate kinase [Oscillospiraceae bacterium]|jgi:guanylate kinase|nr:guanylate kinase [Oscillospiraceae bacterium]
MRKGFLIVISAPAGCGKDTIVERLLEKERDIRYSVSTTTREIRNGETEGSHYFFKTRKEFEELIERGEFLEYTEYCGNYYGTRKAAVMDALDNGFDILLKIEVHGAEHIKKMFPDSVLVFIHPPSLEELRRRLIKRGTEDLETIEHRISVAVREMSMQCDHYDHYIINDDLDKAVNEIRDIIHKKRREQQEREERG